MAVKYYNRGTAYRLAPKRVITDWLHAVAEAEGYKIGYISYILCSSEYHRQINVDYLGHDYFTDVITFDESDRNGRGTVSGDIFIDVETVFDNARIYHTIPVNEMRRVLVHGLLHLCGQNDNTPHLSTVMRRKENRYLKMLKPMLQGR